MPDEVDAGAARVSVVHAVVAEHPHLVGVQARQQRELRRPVGEAGVAEERAVRGVVAQDEERADREPAGEPENRQDGGPIDDDQQGGDAREHHQVASQVGEAAPGRDWRSRRMAA